MSTKFDQVGIQCNLSEFPPNLTGQIRPVELGVNPLRLHCLLKAFDWSNLDVNPLRLHCLLNAFNRHLSQWIYTQFDQVVKFDQALITGQNG